MKVLLQVPMSPYSGYGNDGIGMARAFLRAGADVFIEPTAVQAPLPQDIALLLTKEARAPFDLIIRHVDPSGLVALPEVKAATGMYVGWTMWEYSNFKNLPGRSKVKGHMKNFDAMVGYDDVSVGCLKDVFKGPVIKQQGGFLPEDWPELERDWDEQEFRMCMIGVLSTRKGPWVSIRAFTKAQAEDAEFAKLARLSLKTTAPGLHSKMEDVYPGLRIFYDSWPKDVVKQFYQANHVLLAPSRGEGKNMPALEFQSTGGTVIATDWGGHREWLNPEYNYALNYELEPVDGFPDTFHAEASIEHLKDLMLHAFHNRDEVRRKGEIAAQVIPQLASWDNVIARLIEKLREVPGGETLWTKYSMLGGFSGDS